MCNCKIFKNNYVLIIYSRRIWVIRLIVASSLNGVIGYKNQLPFHIPEDLKLFQEKTKGSTVVMGRKTYESLPDKYRPLPDRKNVVISRSNFDPKDDSVKVTSNLEMFLCSVSNDEDVWIIGGESIYTQSLKYVKEIHHTRVLTNTTGDKYFHVHDLKDFRLETSTMQSDGRPGKFSYSIDIYKRR